MQQRLREIRLSREVAKIYSVFDPVVMDHREQLRRHKMFVMLRRLDRDLEKVQTLQLGLVKFGSFIKLKRGREQARSERVQVGDMSVSIGIGVPENSGSLLESDLLEVAAQHGYGIGCGLDSFENDVHEGIASLTKVRDWNAVYSLRAPKDASANLAFGVYEELQEFECKGADPKFFAFCRDLAKKASEQGSPRIGVFFASEWYKDDRIRFACGDVGDLIRALSTPGGWMLNVLNPVTGRVEEWDELPYFFDLAVEITR